MMISTLLFLTFLSMAASTPQGSMNTVQQDPDLGQAKDGISLKEGQDTIKVKSTIKSVNTDGTEIVVMRTAAPPPENLLAQYIFTTYHLLLKDIRNEAGDTEINAKRV